MSLRLRALWSDEPTHHSEFTEFTNCIVRPRPTNASIPIHVGGHSKAAARRAGRLGDGYYPVSRGSSAELAELFALARSTATDAGRDPAAIEMTTGGSAATGRIGADEIRALADIGADRILVPSFMFWRDPAGPRWPLRRRGHRRRRLTRPGGPLTARRGSAR